MHCQEAVRLEPGLAAAHNNLGNAFRRWSAGPEAHRAYAEALRLSPFWAIARSTPISAWPCNATANWPMHSHSSVGRSSWPLRRPRCRNTCKCPSRRRGPRRRYPLLRADRRPKARASEAHNDLGWALQEEGRLTEAAACYRRALELEPDSVNALLKQGGLHEELGAMAEAEASYRRPGQSATGARTAGLPGDAAAGRVVRYGQGCHPLSPRRPRARRRAARQPCFSPWPMPATLAANSPMPRPAWSGPTPWPCNSGSSNDQTYDAAEHSRFVDRLIDGFHAGAVSSAYRRRRRHATACLRLRHAAFRHDAGRAGAGQPYPSPRRRRTAARPPGLRSMPWCSGGTTGSAVPERPRPYGRARAGPGLSSEPREFSSGRPGSHRSGSWTRCRTTIFISACSPWCSPGHADPRPPRPRDVAVSCWMTNFRSIRWANDPGASGRPIPRNTATSWITGKTCCRRRCTRSSTSGWSTISRRGPATGGGLRPGLGAGLLAVPSDGSRPVRTASVTQVRQPLYRKSVARWKNYETCLAVSSPDCPVAN